MKFGLTILILIFLNTVQAATSSSVVKCAGRIQGIYSLDYLRMIREGDSRVQIKEKSEFAIESGILQYLGYIQLSYSAFDFFVIPNMQPNNYSGFNVLQEAAFGFDPIQLGVLKKNIPDECVPEQNSYFPVLTLENSPNNRVISFDPKYFAMLKAQAPIQLQFLVARLWLNEFTDDDELIYSILRLLYRTDIVSNQVVQEELRVLFQKLVLSIKSSSSVCERSQFILEAYKRLLKKNCDQISVQDLANIQELTIIDKDRRIIDFNNFQVRKIDAFGLTHVTSFSAQNVPWMGVALFEGFFSAFENLQNLNLSKTNLRNLTRGLLPIREGLLTLHLSDSSLGSIRPGAFQGVFTKDPSQLTTLDLSLNFIEKLESENLQGLQGLKILNLSDTNIEKMDLSSLGSLEELNLSEAMVKGTLRSGDFPQLRSLNISSRRSQELRIEGSWPQLESLDASMYSAGALPPEVSFKDFPNLRFLDLSANTFYGQFGSGKNSQESGFASLNKLEHVRFLDTNFIHEKDTNREGIERLISRELPPNLKILEVCNQGWSDNLLSVRVIMKEVMKSRPGLRVRTKRQCVVNEEWVDVTL